MNGETAVTEKDTKPAEATKGKPAVYVATAPLTMGNGTLAYAEGSEVPAHILDGDVAKANGWNDNVKKQ